jgi:hypothetical protein
MRRGWGCGWGTRVKKGTPFSQTGLVLPPAPSRCAPSQIDLLLPSSASGVLCPAVALRPGQARRPGRLNRHPPNRREFHPKSASSVALQPGGKAARVIEQTSADRHEFHREFASAVARSGTRNALCGNPPPPTPEPVSRKPPGPWRTKVAALLGHVQC